MPHLLGGVVGTLLRLLGLGLAVVTVLPRNVMLGAVGGGVATLLHLLGGTAATPAKRRCWHTSPPAKSRSGCCYTSPARSAVATLLTG